MNSQGQPVLRAQISPIEEDRAGRRRHRASIGSRPRPTLAQIDAERDLGRASQAKILVVPEIKLVRDRSGVGEEFAAGHDRRQVIGVCVARRIDRIESRELAAAENNRLLGGKDRLACRRDGCFAREAGGRLRQSRRDATTGRKHEIAGRLVEQFEDQRRAGGAGRQQGIGTGIRKGQPVAIG